jgi:hypothetical protein
MQFPHMPAGGQKDLQSTYRSHFLPLLVVVAADHLGPPVVHAQQKHARRGLAADLYKPSSPAWQRLLQVTAAQQVAGQILRIRVHISLHQHPKVYAVVVHDLPKDMA